jgi:hypothetical protein
VVCKIWYLASPQIIYAIASGFQGLVFWRPPSKEASLGVVFLPGTDDITEVAEPEIDGDELILQQKIFLDRWQALGEEIKRRVDILPRDLHFELCELLREVR